MHLAFWHRGVPCHPWSVHTSPLGGTESALLFMAEALAARGHDVHVYTELVEPAPNVERTPSPRAHYHHWHAFETDTARRPFDVVVIVRNLLPFLAGRWGRLQLLWTPDAYDQPFLNAALPIQFRDDTHTYDLGLYSLRFVQRYLDAIICVGRWQAQTLTQRFAVPDDKLYLGYNGVHVPHFTNPPLSVRRRELVYCSTPFRGLEFLLRWFPEIRARVPDATCTVMSGMQLYGASSEEDRAQYADLYALAEQPGVELIGPLPKPRMAQRLAVARVLAYPNTFAETFCIAALEAQAAGLPIVTTQLAAMNERVTDGHDGILIPGHPRDVAYRDAFIDATVRLLTDDAEWRRLHDAIPAKVTPFQYATLAAQWEEEFTRRLSLPRAETPATPLRPTPQFCAVTVDGYPKHLALSADLLHRHLTQALTTLGFPQSAAVQG